MAITEAAAGLGGELAGKALGKSFADKNDKELAEAQKKNRAEAEQIWKDEQLQRHEDESERKFKADRAAKAKPKAKAKEPKAADVLAKGKSPDRTLAATETPTAKSDIAEVEKKEYKPPERSVEGEKKTASAPAPKKHRRFGGIKAGLRFLGRGVGAVARGAGKAVRGTAKGTGKGAKYVWQGKS